jgi:Helicase associated domain
MFPNPSTINSPNGSISVKNIHRRLRTTASSSPSNNGTDDDNSNDEERKEAAASVLAPTRIQRLVDLGFVFATTEKNPHRKSSEWVQVLQAFKEGHGHCRVPHDYPPDPGLSAWLHRQRNEYRKYQEQLKLGDDILATRL